MKVSLTKGFAVTDPNIRVKARVVANVDRQTYRQMDGKLDPYITPCLRQVKKKLGRKSLKCVIPIFMPMPTSG